MLFVGRGRWWGRSEEGGRSDWEMWRERGGERGGEGEREGGEEGEKEGELEFESEEVELVYCPHQIRQTWCLQVLALA